MRVAVQRYGEQIKNKNTKEYPAKISWVDRYSGYE